jgi:histidyl-tRNA synthetase
MSNVVEPRLPGGFRDLDPQLAAARRRLIEIVEAEYRAIGSQPLDTPAVEYEDVLIGGEDYSKQLYHVVRRAADEGEAVEKNPLAMRFDLTVPLARYVASHPDLPMPFIRHQVGQVWRGERQQQGRYHEFTQFDIDIVGSSSLAADAQILATMYRVMTALVGDRFVIKYSHRGLISAAIDAITPRFSTSENILRVFDKLDKISREQGMDELKRLGATDAQAIALLSWAVSDNPKEYINSNPEFVRIAQPFIDELKTLERYFVDLDISDERLHFDTSVVRGLGYYTGPVWETVLLDAPEFGSVYSGGRYDNLLERFGSRKLPATGTSIGVDRMLAALEKLGKLPELAGSSVQALVVNFGEELMPEQLKLVAELRAAGVSTEIYLGKEKGLGQQLGYAQGRGAAVAILFGADEQKAGEVKLKNLATKEQISIPRTNIVAEVRKLLK